VAFRRRSTDSAVEKVAAYGTTDVDRLLVNPGIVRNRAKVTAAITNARAALDVAEGLEALLWSYAPDPASRPAPQTLADVITGHDTNRRRSPRTRCCGFVFVDHGVRHHASHRHGRRSPRRIIARRPRQ
jgi:DNA-3-methyladenine glycosylase I